MTPLANGSALSNPSTYVSKYENIDALFIHTIMQINMLQPISTSHTLIKTKDAFIINYEEWETFYANMCQLFPHLLQTYSQDRKVQSIAYLTFEQIKNVDFPLNSTKKINDYLTKEQVFLCAKFCIEWLKYHPIDIHYKTSQNQDPMIYSFICHALCHSESKDAQDACLSEIFEFVTHHVTPECQKTRFLRKIFETLSHRQDLPSTCLTSFMNKLRSFNLSTYNHTARAMLKNPSSSKEGEYEELKREPEPVSQQIIPLDEDPHNKALTEYIQKCTDASKQEFFQMIETIETYNKRQAKVLDWKVTWLQGVLSILTYDNTKAYLVNEVPNTYPNPCLLMHMLKERRNYILADYIKPRLKLYVDSLLSCPPSCGILSIMLQYDPKSFFTLFVYCDLHKDFSKRIAQQLAPQKQDYEEGVWQPFLNEALFHNHGALITQMVVKLDFTPRFDWAKDYHTLMTLKPSLPIPVLEIEDQGYVIAGEAEGEADDYVIL